LIIFDRNANHKIQPGKVVEEVDSKWMSSGFKFKASGLIENGLFSSRIFPCLTMSFLLVNFCRKKIVFDK